MHAKNLERVRIKKTISDTRSKVNLLRSKQKRMLVFEQKGLKYHEKNYVIRMRMSEFIHYYIFCCVGMLLYKSKVSLQCEKYVFVF